MKFVFRRKRIFGCVYQKFFPVTLPKNIAHVLELGCYPSMTFEAHKYVPTINIITFIDGGTDGQRICQ